MTAIRDDGVVVRPAVPGDLHRVHEINLATHSTRTSPGPAGGDPDRYRDDLDDLLVATVDRHVHGMVLLGRPTPLASNRHVWMVQGLDVHPDAQGVGLGRRLVAAAMDEARARGGRRLTLRVLANNDVARRFYTSMGFVVEGVLVGEFVLDGVEVDDVLMARRLDDRPRGSGLTGRVGRE